MSTDRAVPTASEISNRIHGYVMMKLLPGEDPNTLTNSTPLMSGGVIDSLTAMELGAFIEESFEVVMAPDELTNPLHMDTIDSITSLIITKLQASV